MSYVTIHWFRAQMSKLAIMDFIARTPAELYFLVPHENWVYGAVVSDDLLEYLCNEFEVVTLEILSQDNVMNIYKEPGAKLWGNKELVNN